MPRHGTTKKKTQPPRQGAVSTIKHYYKTQNLEGIWETFSSNNQPNILSLHPFFRLQRYIYFPNRQNFITFLTFHPYLFFLT